MGGYDASINRHTQVTLTDVGSQALTTPALENPCVTLMSPKLIFQEPAVDRKPDR